MLILIGEVDEFFLDASGDDDGVGSVRFCGVFFHLRDERVSVWVLRGFAEFFLADVAGKDGFLSGEEEEVLEEELFVLGEV